MPGRFLNLTSKTAYNKLDLSDYYDRIESFRAQYGLATTFDVLGVTDLLSPALEGTYKLYFMGRFNRASTKADAPTGTVTDPSWLDLWCLADELIVRQESGHRTHLYVEAFEEDEEGDLRVVFGS